MENLVRSDRYVQTMAGGKGLIGQYSLETYFFTEAAARELLNQLSHNFDKKHYGTRDSDLGFTL